MKHINRRGFLLGTVSVLAIQATTPVKAGLHLHGTGGGALGQSVVNIGNSALAFINLAHGMLLTSSGGQANFPSLLTADGYPNDPAGTAITSTIRDSAFNSWDATYYGRYKLWWTGTGCLVSGQPAIIYSGGAAVIGLGAGSGTVGANAGFGGAGTQPRSGTPVEFAFGALVTSVSGGGGSLVTINHTAVNFGSGFATGTWIKLGQGVSANLANGPNFDGSWQITNVSATSFTLNGSTGVSSPTVTGTGGAGSQSEALSRVGNAGNGQGFNFPNGQIYSGFSDLVICKSANAAAVLAGQLASPEYINALKGPAGMNPAYIRFMDYTAVQFDRASSHTYRTKTTNLSWGAFHYVPDYFVTTAANTGVVGSFSDVYTCANPTASGVGAYADGEQVAFQIPATNTGWAPALNVNSRGAAPILNPLTTSNAAQKIADMTGTLPTNGSVQTLTFSGAGLGSPHNVTYTKGAGDTSFNILGSQIRGAVQNDATLTAAGIFAPFNGALSKALYFSYNPNIGGLGSSPLTVTGTDASGNTIYHFGTCEPSTFVAGSYATFAYSKLIGAWLTVCDNSGASSSLTYGPHYGAPLEFYVDMCNRVSCGLYLQIGQLWDQTRISSTATLIAGSLNAGLKFKPGYSNETWNNGAAEWTLSQTLGCCLGFLNTLSALSIGQDSLTGLRMAQLSNLVSAAWTGAGRSRSDLKVQMECWSLDIRAVGSAQYPTSTNTYRFNGTLLNPASNTMLANFGAIGVSAYAINHAASPNRPIDLSDDAGGAPYYAGGQFNCGGAFGIGSGLQTVDYSGAAITISSYNSLLLAAWNYVNGNSTQQGAALDFLYDGTNGDLYNGLLHGTYTNNWQLASWEITSADPFSPGTFGIGSVLQSYDTGRTGAGLSQIGYVCYEGSLQTGPLAGDISTLINSLNALGDTAGYSSGLPGAAAGSSTVAGDAANIQTLMFGNDTLPGFVGDNRYKLLTLKYLTLCQQSGRWVSGSTFVNSRTSMGTTYGFEGPGYWSIYKGLLGAVPQPKQAVNALQAFDN